jgi:hypothetical protein
MVVRWIYEARKANQAIQQLLVSCIARAAQQNVQSGESKGDEPSNENPTSDDDAKGDRLLLGSVGKHFSETDAAVVCSWSANIPGLGRLLLDREQQDRAIDACGKRAEVA